jgi:hypothetical protein
MKITKQQLKRIIKEELSKVLREQGQWVKLHGYVVDEEGKYPWLHGRPPTKEAQPTVTNQDGKTVSVNNNSYFVFGDVELGSNYSLEAKDPLENQQSTHWRGKPVTGTADGKPVTLKLEKVQRGRRPAEGGEGRRERRPPAGPPVD